MHSLKESSQQSQHPQVGAQQILQVGVDQIWDQKAQKHVLLKYSHIPTTEQGFVTDLSYRPITRDLLYLQRAGKPKTINGWWTGKKWFGLRLRKDDVITAWKRNFEDDKSIY